MQIMYSWKAMFAEVVYMRLRSITFTQLKAKAICAKAAAV